MSETLAERLKRLRDARGLSRTQLAEMCGASSCNVVFQWEINRTRPRIYLLPSLAAALGVTVDCLLTGHDPTETEEPQQECRPEDVAAPSVAYQVESFSARETFAERLKRLRIASGLTITQVAECIGVTPPVVRRAENGEHQIRAHRMPELARRLGVTTDYLLTGTDPNSALRRAILIGTRPEILLAMARREI